MILCRKKDEIGTTKAFKKTPLILNDFFGQKITENDKSMA